MNELHQELLKIIACPICRTPLTFDGQKTGERFSNGSLKCDNGHLYQVKEEIGLLKDAKVSAKEFEWKVDIADERKYDKINRQYNSYLTEEHKHAIRQLTERLVHYAALSCKKTDSKLVDIATGMGRFFLPLAKKSAKDTLIVGTDIDEKPLRGTMNKARKSNLYDKVSLIVTDAKHLSFKSNSILTMTSNFGFDNVPETVLAFKECARVLQRGGRVIFSSLWYSENSENMKLADEHGVGQIASEARLREALKSAELALERVEKVYSGVWSYNPMDLLPSDGDKYTLVAVRARKIG